MRGIGVVGSRGGLCEKRRLRGGLSRASVFGQKNGPLGPTHAAGLPWTGPRRYLLEVSIFVCCIRGQTCSHACVHPRHKSDYSRGILAIERFTAGVSTAARRAPPASGSPRSALRRRARPRTSSPSSSSTRVAARRSSASTSSSARSQRSCQASRLASILRRPWAVSRETTTRRSISERTRSTWPRSARWSSIWVTVAGVSRAAAASSPAESSPRSSSSIKQLELGVAQLRAVEVRVAPAQAAEAAKHAAERVAELGQLTPGARVAAWRGGVAVAAIRLLLRAERLDGGLGVGRGAAAAAARGFSARSSTTQGISASAAIPSDHQ